MTISSSPRLTGTPWFAGLVILLAAISGGIAGVAVDRLVLLPHLFRGPGERHEHRGPPGDDFRRRFGREIGLTPEQQARVDSIMDREMRGVHEVRAAVQPRLDSIVARTRKELDAVLTPEQREKAEAMRKRHPPPSGPPGAGPDRPFAPGGPPDVPPDAPPPR